MASFRSTVIRLTSALALAGLLLIASALPASAEPSTGWPKADPVDGLHVLLLLGGIPLLLFVGIAAFVMLPPLARGESLRPQWVQPSSDQWIGGPRRDVGQLAAPDSEDSQAGGASGRW